ncbi:MAG: hypothetical protein H8D45_08905 [Bacteroidetes bacterium]|nr:hypothetical protein [Bacteroidota bacterium]MBL7103579.1 hypothetical protein [Bacteroidales bacterium]
MKQFLLIGLMFIINHTYSQQDIEKCNVLFQILTETSVKDTIFFEDLKECIGIVEELSNCDYVVNNSTISVSQSITKPFADVCIKADGDSGAQAYIDYVGSSLLLR